MSLKKVIWGAVGIIALFVFFLSTGFVADQCEKWVDANPEDPKAPVVLYRAGRWCDLLGGDDRAVGLYEKLYRNYPEEGDLVAPAMVHSAEIRIGGSYVPALRLQGVKYLEIVLNQYAAQSEWHAKAQKLYDEVVHAY